MLDPDQLMFQAACSEVKGEKNEEEEKLTYSNIVYRGSTVANGSGKAVVVLTGHNTKMGLISKMLSEVESSPTPLQERLGFLGKALGIWAIFLCLIVFIYGLATGSGLDPYSTQSPVVQMLLLSVSLIVAAVPEGLPVCVTVALAIGMQSMARNCAQVKTLKSVETLGSASIICSDKTGTLTRGEMTVVGFSTLGQDFTVSGTGFEPKGVISPSPSSPDALKLLAVAGLCNSSEISFDKKVKQWVAIGNLTENALMALYMKAQESKTFQATKVQDNPFDSLRKMASTVVKFTSGCPFSSESVTLVKGAPNVLLEHCTSVCHDGKVRCINFLIDFVYLFLPPFIVLFSYAGLFFCYLNTVMDNHTKYFANSLYRCYQSLMS